MKKHLIFRNIVSVLLFAVPAFGQQPTPTPVDETVKVRTDEVHLNVTALSSYGRFVPTLKAEDLLVVEEGTPQTITTMKRVPASVMLLLDTGGNLNFVKSAKLICFQHSFWRTHPWPACVLKKIIGILVHG